jgi:hypothetical protein
MVAGGRSYQYPLGGFDRPDPADGHLGQRPCRCPASRSRRRRVNPKVCRRSPLTPATARQLGAAFIAAAVEAEQMAGYDKITVS